MSFATPTGRQLDVTQARFRLLWRLSERHLVSSRPSTARRFQFIAGDSSANTLWLNNEVGGCHQASIINVNYVVVNWLSDFIHDWALRFRVFSEMRFSD
jgi:hypothetical protein